MKEPTIDEMLSALDDAFSELDWADGQGPGNPENHSCYQPIRAILEQHKSRTPDVQAVKAFLKRVDRRVLRPDEPFYAGEYLRGIGDELREMEREADEPVTIES